MGSFNETCGISRLPIRNGDPVVVFILIENGVQFIRKYAIDYADDLYQPVAPAISATYNDYGEVTDVESSLTYNQLDDIVNKSLSMRRLRIEPLGEFVELVPEPTDVESLLYKINKHQQLGCKLMFIHTGVYEKSLELASKIESGADETLSINQYVLSQLNQYVDIHQNREPFNPYDVDVRNQIHHDLTWNRFKDYTHTRNMSYFQDYTVYVDNDQLRVDVSDLITINIFFTLNNIPWFPQIASQSDGLELAIAIGDIANSMKKKHIEEFGE